MFTTDFISDQLALRLLGGFILLVSVTVFVYLIRGLRFGHASQHWPHTTGTILESFVERCEGNEGADSYYPKITYTYEVNESVYEANEWSHYAIDDRKGETAAAIIEAFPKGKATKVYYDPTNPSHAVLQPGIARRDYIPGFIVAGVLLSIGLLLVIMGDPWAWFAK